MSGRGEEAEAEELAAAEDEVVGENSKVEITKIRSRS